VTNDLSNILKQYPRHYEKIITKHHTKLLEEIYTSTNFLAHDILLKTRIYCILNDIYELPKCRTCGKEITVDIQNMKSGFKKYCSPKCATLNIDVSLKRKSSCLEKYGYENPFQNNQIKEKIKQTNLEKYGCEVSSQNKDVIKKMKQTNIEKYGVQIVSQNRCIQEKIKKTNLEKYGYENVAQNKDIREKIKQTNLEKYGVEHFNNKDKAKKTCLEKYGVDHFTNFEKTKQTNLERYGHEYALQTPLIQEKIKTTNLRKYGVEYAFQNNQIQEKIRQTNLEKYGVEHFNNKDKYIQTCLEKYGVEHPSQNREIRLKQQSKYTYDSKSFDSAPEIALYIYLKDNNIDFEYQPNIKFEYLIGEKTRYYFPDFRIEDKYYEIKGDQFFDSDNKMINPYDRSQDVLYESKHQCMRNNNVTILKSNDYQKYIDYISEKYGKDYLKQFKNT
jgi:hypothetical protein